MLITDRKRRFYAIICINGHFIQVNSFDPDRYTLTSISLTFIYYAASTSQKATFYVTGNQLFHVTPTETEEGAFGHCEVIFYIRPYYSFYMYVTKIKLKRLNIFILLHDRSCRSIAFWKSDNTSTMRPLTAETYELFIKLFNGDLQKTRARQIKRRKKCLNSFSEVQR